MSFIVNEEDMIRNPQFYQQKANKLRLQNQILRRQLQSNNPRMTQNRTNSPSRLYNTLNGGTNYTYYANRPVQQVIYRPSNEPVRPPVYIESRPISENYMQRARTQTYSSPYEREARCTIDHVGCRHDQLHVNQVEQEIIELQSRSYKLERQANRLSTYIKDDLKGFVKDSNIHKQCSYRQKYLRSIANRPRYFRFNM